MDEARRRIRTAYLAGGYDTDEEFYVELAEVQARIQELLTAPVDLPDPGPMDLADFPEFWAGADPAEKRALLVPIARAIRVGADEITLLPAVESLPVIHQEYPPRKGGRPRKSSRDLPEQKPHALAGQEGLEDPRWHGVLKWLSGAA